MRRTIILGGALALVSGLATAFLPGLAYVVVTVAELNPRPGVVYPYAKPYFDYSRLMIHTATIGMLISCVGAFLGIVSRGEKEDVPRLGFAGVILGLLGFLLSDWKPDIVTVDLMPIVTFWWGPSLTMLGILVMFWGLVVESGVVPRLTLLGCPLLMAAWLLQPLLVVINLPLLVTMEESGFMGTIFTALNFSGFLPTLAGCVIGVEKEGKRIKGSDLTSFTVLFLSFLMILYLLALLISSLV